MAKVCSWTSLSRTLLRSLLSQLPFISQQSGTSHLRYILRCVRSDRPDLDNISACLCLISSPASGEYVGVVRFPIGQPFPLHPRLDTTVLPLPFPLVSLGAELVVRPGAPRLNRAQQTTVSTWFRVLTRRGTQSVVQRARKSSGWRRFFVNIPFNRCRRTAGCILSKCRRSSLSQWDPKRRQETSALMPGT